MSTSYTHKLNCTGGMMLVYQAYLNPPISSLIRSNDDDSCSNSNSDDSFFCVGDHRETATLNGALVSGRRAAELIIKSRK